jgi:hypothetical protein
MPLSVVLIFKLLVVELSRLVQRCIIPILSGFQKFAPFSIPSFADDRPQRLNVTELDAMDSYFERAGFVTL